MENKNQLKLSNKFVKYLENLPEQGMGYQVVDIELINDIVLTDRIVFNSTYLKLNDGEQISNKQIYDIKIKTI